MIGGTPPGTTSLLLLNITVFRMCPADIHVAFATPSVDQGPLVGASLGSLLEMQNLRPYSRPFG